MTRDTLIPQGFESHPSDIPRGLRSLESLLSQDVVLNPKGLVDLKVLFRTGLRDEGGLGVLIGETSLTLVRTHAVHSSPVLGVSASLGFRLTLVRSNTLGIFTPRVRERSWDIVWRWVTPHWKVADGGLSKLTRQRGLFLRGYQ